MAFVTGTKRHNFGPQLKDCMFLFHLLSFAEKRLKEHRYSLDLVRLPTYLIDQLIVFRPHVDPNDEKCVDTAKSCVSSRSVSDV